MTSVTNSEQAVAVAERMLDEHVRPAIDDEVAVTDVREFPTCWVIGFNTVAYLETGSIARALVGLGPVIVNRRSGKARIGTSASPADRQLDSR